MIRVLGCLVQQHDLRLVALAGLLCLFASFTAMIMIARARQSQGRICIAWVIAAGTVTGCGIWATHFIAMLAYNAGVPVGYDTSLTLLSVLIAVLLSSAGIALTICRPGAIAGGAVVGLAIVAMHYAGMEAVRAPAIAVWNSYYVAASMIVGVTLMAIVMHVALTGRSLRAYALGTLLFTLAICGMHFTGMAAVSFIPDSSIVNPDAVLDPDDLAISIAAVALMIVALGLIGAMLDQYLANRAANETQLRTHIVELEETKRALSTALASADAANQAKSQFLAAMSHELRTPLNAVLGYSEMMTAEMFGPLGDEHYRGCARDIHASGSHLLALVSDILDLSRLDAVQTTLEDEDLDLGAIVLETVRMMRGQAEAAHVALSEHIADGLPQIRADRRRVRQVLINLLSNAIKFTQRDGFVRVSASRSGGGVALTVADTGIGIAPEDIPKAFERFSQVDSRLARRYEGAGLGLPLAKQLMELHGGRLELESALNAGTTVTAIFPAERIVGIERAA